jgi:3-hydroxyacyl-CoA dehydrogenase/enoyl-CoA hydratase/3-hydroxybutyryl-CoA epimerase
MSTNNIHGFIYEKDANDIAVVTMDMDGSVNAMNAQYRKAMSETVDKLYSEVSLRGVVFTSAKTTFFAGGDLKEMLSVRAGEEEQQFQQIQLIKHDLRRLEQMKVPVVAAINGAALGGGFEICLACNHRIMLNHPKVVIGFPEVTLGLLPGAGGVVRSVHMLGMEKSLPHLLEGLSLGPKAAIEAGFVDTLVDDADGLIEAAKTWIKSHFDDWQQPWDKKHHTIPGGDIWHPKIINMLAMAPAALFKKTRGLLPAPERILSLVGDTLAVDFDTALRIEARALAYLITTPQAKNIITSMFIQMNAIRRDASRPKNIGPNVVQKLGILGAGMMGQGIAYAAAIAGIDVVLKDVTKGAAEKGKQYTQKMLDKGISKGQLTAQQKDDILQKIKPSESYQDLIGCDLIIEAVFEDLALKTKVIAQAQEVVGEKVIFATNTSTLPITQIANSILLPERFIGIHFFSPVDKMPLIEIICGERSSEQTLAIAFDFVKQIKKTPIVVNDSLGFFTSRVFGTFMDEGARLLMDGLDPVLIESLAKQVGMPVGPLAVQDEVSQELSKKAAATHREMGVFCSLGDNSANVKVSERLIKEYSRGGRYHGGGYYDYAEDGSKAIWPELYSLYHKPEVEISYQDIKDRILFRQVIESLKCLQEGVLRSVADGNIGSLLGIGAPKWTGGFIQFVNTYGLDNFIKRCDELVSLYGERFVAPKIVVEKAARHQYFD